MWGPYCAIAFCFLPRPDHKYNPFKRLQTITADPTLLEALLQRNVLFFLYNFNLTFSVNVLEQKNT